MSAIEVVGSAGYPAPAYCHYSDFVAQRRLTTAGYAGSGKAMSLWALLLVIV